MYKVLWFDDEHKTLELIKEEALLQDVSLIGFENAEQGLIELLSNYKNYDAVLLDGLFFKKEGQTGDVKSQEAFGEVAKVLGNLKAKGIVIPWFIYSGQKSFVKEKNELVNVLIDKSFANGKIFDKNIDDDFIELCTALKTAADKSPQTQARLSFSEVFTVFKKGIIDQKHEHLLLDMLINYKNKDYRKKNVTVQRDLLEAIFKALNNPIPYLKNEFFDNRFKGKPNLEYCVRFIEGKPVNQFKSDKTIKKTIQSAFRILKESACELSHLNDEEIVKYPFLNNTFLLLQILIWLPEFVEEHYENYI